MTHAELAEELRQIRARHRLSRPADAAERAEIADLVLANFGQIFDALNRANGWSEIGQSMAELLGYEEHDDADIQNTLYFYLRGLKRMAARTIEQILFQDEICHRLIHHRKLFDTNAQKLEKCLARITELELSKSEVDDER